ncbi:MAG: hypothetical protein OXG60_07775 [Chloroflexi bacterium]|nr:hypothetical protein [Chloroflexota bacterium]
MPPHAILPSMENPYRFPAWIDKLKVRGGAPLALLALDVIEPLAPVLAQGLWMAQPLAGLWNGRDDIRDLATLLEAPEGIEGLRRRLAED